MAVLKIARMGHPALMGIAEPVSDPRDPEIRRLVADMVDTMRDAPGIGLAAPQVHVPLRLVIYMVPEGRTDDGEGHPLTALINPEITVQDDALEEGVEGCLSLPGMAGRVARPRHIRINALDLDGNALEYEAEGYHARVVQHECDHLDGILYPMRMTDLASFGYVEEMTKAPE
ncbi:MAG: peptide deformylase [Rhodospirillales bacterium]|nr:peptide deformylase [Rhodospirillales bacterium]MBO6787441.1 peptide deformylase [Rhodospirillales bacterium]